MDQTGKVANPARGQLNRENVHYGISLSRFAPMNLVSRDGFGRPVPRQHAHLDTQAKFGILTNHQKKIEVGYSVFSAVLRIERLYFFCSNPAVVQQCTTSKMYR